jgi:hypothetical protein
MKNKLAELGDFERQRSDRKRDVHDQLLLLLQKSKMCVLCKKEQRRELEMTIERVARPTKYLSVEFPSSCGDSRKFMHEFFGRFSSLGAS